jgi:hypothetical protein
MQWAAWVIGKIWSRAEMTRHVGCAELSTACRADPSSVRRDQAAGVEAA